MNDRDSRQREKEALYGLIAGCEQHLEALPRGATRLMLGAIAKRLEWHGKKTFGDQWLGDAMLGAEPGGTFHLLASDGTTLCLTSDPDDDGATEMCSTCSQAAADLANWDYTWTRAS